MEIRVSFCIDGRRYRLFIEKKWFRYNAYLFQETDTERLLPVKIQKISASTLAECVEHWLMCARLYLRQKIKRHWEPRRLKMITIGDIVGLIFICSGMVMGIIGVIRAIRSEFNDLNSIIFCAVGYSMSRIGTLIAALL